MRTLILAIALALTAISPGGGEQAAAPNASPAICAPMGSAHLRTTLYFGLSHKSGTVSEAQWRAFLREQVTPRFPDGLTVWEAAGQWRQSNGKIGRERAKVLLLVHEDTATVRSAVSAIIESYKRAFQQESVLWETAPVCAAF